MRGPTVHRSIFHNLDDSPRVQSGDNSHQSRLLTPTTSDLVDTYGTLSSDEERRSALKRSCMGPQK